VLQCVCCSVLQYVAVSVLQWELCVCGICTSICCSACVAVCCSMLQWVCCSGHTHTHTNTHTHIEVSLVSYAFTWDMTHSCETWLIHVRHDSFILDIWDMTHSSDFQTIFHHIFGVCLVTRSHLQHNSIFVSIFFFLQVLIEVGASQRDDGRGRRRRRWRVEIFDLFSFRFFF